MYKKRNRLLSFISLLLVFVLLLTSCNSTTDELKNQPDLEASTPSDEEQEPGLKLYLWKSADKKIEITEESSLVFGDGSNFEPGEIIVKYFSVKSVSGGNLKYFVTLEAMQPNDAEHKAHSLANVIEYQMFRDTKYGSFEWREDIPGQEIYILNDDRYTPNVLYSSTLHNYGEEVFFAVAIRMDSDATAEYMDKKLYLDVKLNINSGVIPPGVYNGM